MLSHALFLLLATTLGTTSHSASALPLFNDTRLERRLSNVPLTVRKYWPQQAGRVTFNLNWDEISHDSVVVVTAAQFWTMDDKSTEHRVMNNIPITVEAVVPHGPPYDANHGVVFVVNIESSWLVNIVTDITVFPNAPIEIQQYTPDAPADLGLAKVWGYQESANWGWIATAVSLSRFYGVASPWSQCSLMTFIGQKYNGFSKTSSACPSDAIIKQYPKLQNIKDNRYISPDDLFILDNPAYGVPKYYLKTGGVDDALTETAHFKSYQGTSVTLAAIANEIHYQRPVVVAIDWNDGSGSQVITIGGLSGDVLLLFDPVYGKSTMRFADFPANYYGGATIGGYTFTTAVFFD